MPRKMPKQKPGRSKQDYETPKDLLDAIRQRLKILDFEFDFACSKRNKKAPLGWTEYDDSLSKPSRLWADQLATDEWGWLNPPFSKIAPWVKKCVLARWRGANIALLVPASVGSNWYRDHINGQPGVQVIFLNGRPSFDGVAGFPKDCMLVLFHGNGPSQIFSTEVWTWKETAE